MPTKQHKNNNEWKLDAGSISGVGVIHKSDILPTISLLENKLQINLADNLLGSAGKREFSGDIDVAVALGSQYDIDQFYLKLKTIPEIVSMVKSSVIMTSVKVPNWDQQKYKNVKATGLVQVDFMFSDDISLLKLFYHSPYETDSSYKGLYRNILLGAIAHYYDIGYSKEFILNDIPLYEERYFWSADMGLYRGKKYNILSKDKKYIIKKTKNLPNKDSFYKNKEDIVKVLNLSSPDSLYSFESLYEDINNRYDPYMVNRIIDEFVNNRNVKYYGIPCEILKRNEVEYES